MKIAIFIAFRNFRDEEYFMPKEIFERAKAKVITFSTAIGVAVGMQGGDVQVDQLIDDFKAVDFDALVISGGPGAQQLINNTELYAIIQGAVKADKVVGAICIAPTILARAGVLFGKKATVWSSVIDKSAVKILKEEGALYRGDHVVADGKIVTANGPLAAKDFAEKILEVLRGV